MLLKIVSDLKPDYVVAAYDVKDRPIAMTLISRNTKPSAREAEDDLVRQMVRASRDLFAAFNIPIY